MAEYEKMEEDDDLSRQVIIKYMVKDLVEGSICVVKFHLVDRELSIQGYGAHFDFIRYLMDTCIINNDDVNFIPENSHSQRNKVKFIFNYPYKKNFEGLIRRIEELDGVEVSRVKKHGRLA